MTTALVEWMILVINSMSPLKRNPGPDSVDGTTESINSSSSSSFEMLTNHLSILHLNIQSIVPKRTMFSSFPRVGLIPMYLTKVFILKIFHHHSEQTEVIERERVIVYIRDTISSKRRSDLEIRGLEATWDEHQVRSKKVLIGGFYRPPESHADYIDLISESLNRAYDTNIQDIIILGDFNINMFHDTNNKIKYIMQKFYMKQLINEPTNFTESSDLILVRNDTNMLTSGVLDSFIPERIRYHCPVIVLLKFLRPA